MIPSEEIDPDLQEKSVRDALRRKRHLQTSPASTNKKESAALFFVCLLPISLKNIGCDNMRGSMVSCSLCSRKLHMFAVRSGKPSCACLLQRETMQINDGRTEDMDQEVA